MLGPISLISTCLLVALGAITLYCFAFRAWVLQSDHSKRLFWVGLATFLGSLFASFLYQSSYIVGEEELGVAVKKFGSTYLAADKTIAMEGESGWQARVYAPGYHFIVWPRHSVQIFQLTDVPQGHVGILEALDGKFPELKSYNQSPDETTQISSDALENEVSTSVLVSPEA